MPTPSAKCLVCTPLHIKQYDEVRGKARGTTLGTGPCGEGAGGGDGMGGPSVAIAHPPQKKTTLGEAASG